MISVAIVENQREKREGLRQTIDMADGIKCMNVYSDGESALKGIIQAPPDVVLMAIDLPGMSGIECVKDLKKAIPDLYILMLTSHTDDDSIFQSLRAGAIGYLTKATTASKLLAAIIEAYDGGAPMSSYIARRVVSSFRQQPNSDVNLSRREKEVLDLLCEGHNYKYIAEQLFISPNTVRFHLKNIYKKLQVSSKYEAVIKASKEGIV